MPHGEYAQCPKCGRVSWGKEDIKKYFGYRFMGIAPQSWCRKCRKIERFERNCRYTACPWHGERDCSSRYDCPCSDD